MIRKEMNKISTCLILFCLILNSVQSCSNKNCSSEVWNDNGIEVLWSESDNETVISMPICLDANKNVKIRKCCENIPKKCEYYALNVTNKCPPGFDELNGSKWTFCVKVSEPKKWGTYCLKSGAETNFLELPLEQKLILNNYLRKKKIEKFWLPARRENLMEPILWMTPGKNWKNPVDFDNYDVEFARNILAGDCLSLKISNNFAQAMMEDCLERNPHVCIFNANPWAQLHCPIGQYTTIYSYYQKYCYSIEENSNFMGENSNLMPMNSIRDLQLFENLARNYKFLDSKSLCAVQHDTLGNITVNSKGKWMASNKYNCVAMRNEVKRIEEPQIFLKFDKIHQKLLLTVYSHEFLWRTNEKDPGVQCYTDADNELVKVVKIKRKLWQDMVNLNFFSSSVSEKAEMSKTIYELQLYGDGPGYYWCEGHATGFQLIESYKVVAHKKVKGLIYAASVDIAISGLTSSIYDYKYLKNISKTFHNNLKLLMNGGTKRLKKIIKLIKNLRVMKIDRIDVIQKKIRLVFHITVSQDENQVNEVEMYGKMVKNTPEDEDGDNDDVDDEIDELGVPHDVIIYYKLKRLLFELLASSSTAEFKFVALNSTEYCLPENLTVKGEYNFLAAKLGETIVSKELCLTHNGVPVARKCIGDYIYGGIWKDINPNAKCLSQNDISAITRKLYNFGVSASMTAVMNNDNTSTLLETISRLTANYSEIIPADLFYLGRTIQAIKSNHGGVIDNNYINDKRIYYHNLATIFNNIMYVNDSIVRMSQVALNTTNILLDSFDNLINELTVSLPLSSNQTSNDTNNSPNQIIRDAANGTVTMKTSRLIVVIANPLIANVSGIAIFRDNFNENGTIEDFGNYSIRYLKTNESIDDLMQEENLEVAAFVPQSILDRIGELNEQYSDVNTTYKPPGVLNVIITLYYNDRIFQGNKRVSTSKSNAKIISVSIPGYGPDLPGMLPIVFRPEKDRWAKGKANICGYWDFTPTDTSSLGEWASDGCEYIENSYNSNLAVCGCTHMTHFAYLVLGTYVHSMNSEDVIITECDVHSDALDIITLVGCSLSLLGITGIFLTAMTFSSWREKASSKILLQLSTAIALQMILMCFVNTEGYTASLIKRAMFGNCVVIGAILHYSILVAFMWMLITALLQFMRYVKVLGATRPNRFLLKAIFIGWGLPIIPVLTSALLVPEAYIPPVGPTISGICYPSGNALYYALLFPVFSIMAANLVIFILVLYSIFQSSDGKGRATERALTLQQLRLSVFLFFLLGLTWIFGLATVANISIIFSYLFCLTASLQGFILFIYFIAMDPMTRQLWVDHVKRIFCLKCGKSIDENKDLK